MTQGGGEEGEEEREEKGQEKERGRMTRGGAEGAQRR